MSGSYPLSFFRLIIEGLALVLVGILGIVGNLGLIIWFKKKKNNFYQLMSALAFCDLLYIISSMVIFGIPNIFTSLGSTSLYKHLVPILLPLAQCGLTGSIYITMAIAVERYTTVCHPFFKFSSSWSSLAYILPILSFAIVYNIPKFFELQVKTEQVDGNGSLINEENNDFSDTFTYEKNETMNFAHFSENSSSPFHNFSLIEKIAPTSLRLNHLYIKIYLIYLNLFIHGIFPFILLVILNMSIYRQIRLIQRAGAGVSIQQKEIRLAQISLGIVAVFIGCHAVKWIPNIWELAQVGENVTELIWPVWLSYVTCLSHLFTTFNCSVNFYIYSYKHRKRGRERVRQFSTWSTDIVNLDVAISMTELGSCSAIRDNALHR